MAFAPVTLEPYLHPFLQKGSLTQSVPVYPSDGCLQEHDFALRELPVAKQIVGRLKLRQAELTDGYFKDHYPSYHCLGYEKFAPQRITLDKARERRLPIRNFCVADLE